MGTNSSPSGEGVNKQTPIGQSQASSNAWLNIEGRVEKGTVGSRPNMGADKYGGDKDSGSLFKGNSVAKDSKEQNSGGNEKASNNTGQYGDGKFTKGGVGSREGMLKYGGESNTGSLVGAGAGATKDANPADQVKRDLPSQPGQDLILGTNEDRNRNMAKALKGIGKPGAKRM
jgi:hypothetical protein